MDYSARLKDGQEIYIPSWPVDVALENLARAGQQLGTNAIIAIAELNIPTVIVAIMESKDPTQTASLIKHFICAARVGGAKIEEGQVDNMYEGKLALVAEVFAHVIAAQYSDFFDCGLAKAPSPSN